MHCLRTADAHEGAGKHHDHDARQHGNQQQEIKKIIIPRHLVTAFDEDKDLLFAPEQHQNGKKCGTSNATPNEQAKAEEDFQAWKKMKSNIIMGSQEADGPEAMSSSLGIDWSNPTTIITIPAYFHVMHSGTSGKQFTYDSNPAYIQNQIKALNIGFRGEENNAFPPNPNGRSYSRYSISEAKTKIQFCLAGTTATDKGAWYTGIYIDSTNEINMKKALRKGGMETLNVYVSKLGDDFLGWAEFPSSNPNVVLDGVVLLNDSMPGGSLAPYNEGDTLTHEVGHWLGLYHTFQDSCYGVGDYMDLAPASINYTSIAAKESKESFGCDVTLDDCSNDSGKKNPIHSFMAYTDVSSYIADTCVVVCRCSSFFADDCHHPSAFLAGVGLVEC